MYNVSTRSHCAQYIVTVNKVVAVYENRGYNGY